ncbi:MAG: hypothetical protein QFB87_05050 [Patescibacteria group bacterium]|nr:hypothetical protein [Patescibacteria group bacterium]
MNDYDNLRERLCESPLHSDGRVHINTSDILYEAARAITDLDAKVKYLENNQNIELTAFLLSDNARLREIHAQLGTALADINNNCSPNVYVKEALRWAFELNHKALAIESPSTALQEYRDSVIEKCADIADQFCIPNIGIEIRGLKHD